MAEQSFLERRLDASTWPIAVGDVVAILAFIFIGGLSEHWTLEQIQASPEIVLFAAGPFLLGWLVCAPLVGAYSPGGGSAPNSSIPLAIRSWVPAVVVGFVVRVGVAPDRGFDPIFAAIMLVGGALVIGVWRFLYFKLQ